VNAWEELGQPWHLPGLADEIAGALAAAEASLRLEQARHGLDEWDERPLQHTLAAALRRSHQVAVEVHYPSTAGRKLSHRQRCDLVLAPPGDPVDVGDPPRRELWLELKVAHQWRAVGVRDGRYGAQWRRNLVADLRKMAAEPLIRDAALVMIAFTEDETVLHRHLEIFEQVLVRADAVAGFRQVRTLPIADRIGHRTCGVAVWPAAHDLRPSTFDR